MDDALSWFGVGRKKQSERAQLNAGTTARFGGDDDRGPVLVAVISGLVETEMAEDALKGEGIPALVKRKNLDAVYGFAVGSFGAAEVWVPQPLADRARDLLIGIGVLAPSDDR